MKMLLEFLVEWGIYIFIGIVFAVFELRFCSDDTESKTRNK